MIQAGEWSFAKFLDKNVQRMRLFLKKKIIWSNEASFKLNVHVNCHHTVNWQSENPYVEIKKDVNTTRVTVWIGICAAGLVGPFFFDQIVTERVM
jgi:hypothetical protein